MDEQGKYENLRKLGKTLDKVTKDDVINDILDSETGWKVNQLYISSDGTVNLEGSFSGEQLFLIAEYVQYQKENPAQ